MDIFRHLFLLIRRPLIPLEEVCKTDRQTASNKNSTGWMIIYRRRVDIKYNSAGTRTYIMALPYITFVIYYSVSLHPDSRDRNSLYHQWSLLFFSGEGSENLSIGVRMDGLNGLRLMSHLCYVYVMCIGWWHFTFIHYILSLCMLHCHAG